MKQKVKYFLKLFLKPKAFFQHQSIEGKEVYYKLMKVLNFVEYSKRRSALMELKNLEVKPLPEDKGFRRIDDIDQDLIGSAVKRGLDIAKEIDFNELQKKSSKNYLVNTRVDIFDDKNKAIKDFTFHPKIIKMVGDYLGMMPVVENVILLYSPNNNNEGNSSQLFHLDAQDRRTIQIFMYLSDVDESCGPLTVLDATWSEEVIRKTGYKKRGDFKRIEDRDVFKIAPASAVTPFLGNSGSALMVDTDRCLHYGSRKGTKPRYVLVIQYYTPFAFPLPFNWRKGLPYYQQALKNLTKLNRTEKFLLGVN